MNFDKSKVLLKKINAIHDGVADGGGSFSSLEKDLILEYVRDLYEIIRLDQPNSSAPIKEVKKEDPKPRVADTEVVDALPTIPPVQVPTPSSWKNSLPSLSSMIFLRDLLILRYKT